tara:strand:+ start:356 stop:460 length:105 start_codon:yes stop_codon:yes gene_type:complete
MKNFKEIYFMSVEFDICDKYCLGLATFAIIVLPI